jgi:hypothetical protein
MVSDAFQSDHFGLPQELHTENDPLAACVQAYKLCLPAYQAIVLRFLDSLQPVLGMLFVYRLKLVKR